MFDLYVDPTSGDLAFDKGGLRLVKAPNKRVRQELETTLRTFQGEWFNNLSFGGINRAYIGRIGVTKEEVDAWYRRTILANPEVLELVEFESSWNRLTRRYELEFTVRTAAGTESSLITISPEASTEYVQPPQSDYTPPTTPSIKVMSAFITGTSSVSALISQEAIQIAAQIIVGTGAVAASAVREFVAVTVEGSSPTTSATIVKDISATISGSHTVAATMTTVMSAVITSNIGDLSAAIQKVLSSSISGSGSIQASLSKTFAATISGSSTVTAGVAFGFSANIAGTSNVSSSFVKSITANVSATSTTQANMFRVMGASVTASGDISASLAKRLQANVPATSTTTANIRKAMSSTVVGVSSVTAIARKRLAANITSTHNITATIGKGARATLTGTHTISANIRKIKYTGANISGSGNISASLFKIKTMSANIQSSNSISAEIWRGQSFGSYDETILDTSNAIIHLPMHEDFNSVTTLSETNRRVRSAVEYLGASESFNSYFYARNQNYRQPGLLRSTPSYSVKSKAQGLAYNMYTLPTAEARELSFVMWIKTPSTLTNTILCAFDDGVIPISGLAAGQVVLYFTSTGSLRFRFSDSASNGYSVDSYSLIYSTSGKIKPNTTHMVCFTFGGNLEGSSDSILGKANIYVDEEEVTALTYTSPNFVNDYKIQNPLSDIGNMHILTTVGDGSLMTEVNYERASAFNRKLSDVEVRSIYAAGNRTDYDFAVYKNNPVSYRRLESDTDTDHFASGQSPAGGSTGFEVLPMVLSGAGSYVSPAMTRGGLACTGNIVRGIARPLRLISDSEFTFNTWVNLSAYPSIGSSTLLFGITNSSFNIATSTSNNSAVLAIELLPSGRLNLRLRSEDGLSYMIARSGPVLNLNETTMLSVSYDLSEPLNDFGISVAGRVRFFVNAIEVPVTYEELVDWVWGVNGYLPTTSRYGTYFSSELTGTPSNVLQGRAERVSVHSTALDGSTIQSMYLSGTLAGD